MALRSTRRGIILAAGGAVGLAAVGSAVGDQHDDVAVPEGCDVDAARRDLESVEGDLEALRESLAALQVEVVRAHAAGQPPSDFPADVRERALETGLAARPKVAMLDIRSAETEGGGTATGWFIEDGYVVTNAHNVDHDVGGLAGEILCHLPDGRTFDADPVEWVREKPPEPDVAVLATDYDGPGMPLGSSEDLAPDQPLVQVGHPGGFGNWVVALGAFEDRSGGSFTSTVPGLEGNSGSPVMTLDGDVVGMLSSSVGAATPDDESPPVTDAPVQQTLLTQDGVSSHVPVETVVGKLEEWL